MHNRLSFLSLWSINDALNLEALKTQLDELRLAGLEGVIFHPRFYPNAPVYMSQPYLEVVSDLILYAKSTGMIFWIYDENGWPSGTASGEVMRRLPQSTCNWVQWEPDEAHGGRITFGSKLAVSSLNPATTQMFISITYEGYRTGLKAEAFDYVTGFFSDEVAFLDGHGITVKTGGIPWDERFEQQYEAKYGEALLPQLPLLFTQGEGFEQFRVRYWELLTDAIVDGFYRPVAAWCESYGKKFTAHLKAEESPFFQLSYSGSSFQVLKEVETPAIDALERYPGNNYYPRIAHSIAMQQGRSGSLVEAMGGSGWGVSPESFTNYVMWLASHGISCFVLHLNQLKLNTQAIQDWPPSMPSHLTWKAAFPALLASLQAKAALLPDLTRKPDVLIVSPTRGIMAAFDPQDAMLMNEHDGSNIPLTAAGRINENLLALVEACYAGGLHYEFSEERVIEEEGVILGEGFLRIGQRDYDCVLVADGCRWHDAAMEEKLRAAGVTVCGPDDWQSKLPVRKRRAAVRTEAAPAVKQTPWTITPPLRNQIYVELRDGRERQDWQDWQDEKGEKLTAEILLDDAIIEGLSLFIHDPVKEIRVNGALLSVVPSGDGYEGLIGPTMRPIAAAGRLLIEVTPLPGGEACPVAFIRGQFSVVSEAPLLEKDEHQWMLERPFRLAAMPTMMDGRNLIAAGFPFAAEPFKAKKTLELELESKAGAEVEPEAGVGVGVELESKSGSYASLAFRGMQAAAAHVWMDGSDLGWCWGPDWSVHLPAKLLPGPHQLEVWIYPSTFNLYGPHYHLDGDRYLTSPDQYKGIKNFADRPSTSERTRGKHAHFVKWGISGDVQLILSEKRDPS
ncbi:hypothetical protein LOZ80_24375 [Paenibacillus sp. HWE-109]|uniref:hypothetical protein n=1 Tax=Paenibacillus sp. HWE-109 TaxID=1306526 RepID=UPI001EE07E2B|nr:hypothetical protein [Paenibacillus sp. HWE-109]UKS24730.1 hypothetical protein LOZ80_24375 [Paenibacillus sp. HWE-109]